MWLPPFKLKQCHNMVTCTHMSVALMDTLNSSLKKYFERKKLNKLSVTKSAVSCFVV